jgi:hypothetical protein
MITGDNPLTAKAIADESGVDDFLAEATPEDKMALIRKEQEGGKLVAMTGDGTNDAPALAQADVGVAMNTGTSAAKEAGNMVDLDSNPTKLIEIVEIGKQLLITRGALTTFSIANDVAKYFAMHPGDVLGRVPGLAALNILHLYSPKSAITSAIIFNALIIIRADPAGAARRAVPARLGTVAATPEPVDLRRRRPHHPVRRHLGHRPGGPVHPRIWQVNHEPPSHLGPAAHRGAASPAPVHGDLRDRLPAGDDRHRAGGVPQAGRRLAGQLQRPHRRLQPAVPGVHRRQGQPAAAVLPAAPVRRRAAGVKNDYGCNRSTPPRPTSARPTRS